MIDNFSVPIEPFLTYYRTHPDYNELDSKVEFDLMVARNDVVQDFVNGNCTADYLLDYLESQCIDPCTYVEIIEEDLDNCLFLPHAS